MKKVPPSIFNDVIGPVMRGPSSSHTAASVRIGKMIRQILDDEPARVSVEFDREGSLATTYESQGSSIGLAAGLLGWDITHPDLMQALEKAKNNGISIDFNVTSFEADHPNTYRIQLEGKTDKKLLIIAISHGGGVIEIISIDEFKVSIKGDYYEVLCFLSTTGSLESIEPNINRSKSVEQVNAYTSDNLNLVQVKMSAPPDSDWVNSIRRIATLEKLVVLEPVMPVLSSLPIEVPFITAVGLHDLAEKRNLDLFQAALLYECQRSTLSESRVMQMITDIVAVLKQSLNKGLKGTDYHDRILGYQSGKYSNAYASGILLGDNMMNKIMAANMAMMEVKSSMGLIVAAPTAGSCATLPGTLIPVAEELGLNEEDLLKAFLVSGMIGVFISNISTFAAEECGCQAECGSASGMVAAGLVQLMGGSVKQGLAAASMALQNMIGLVCDPVANRVEVPCLGKNIQASLNGLSSANMAMAGLDPVIPLDEVIQAMDEAGRSLPRSLRCTGLGGLSITPSSKRIEHELNKRK